MPDDDGKLKLGTGNQIPYPHETADDPRQVPGFWLGLSLMATRVRARAQRDLRPAARRPIRSWDDEKIFQRARLINAALLAKIHTIEWTPAGHRPPTTAIGDAGELVRARRRADAPHVRPPERERDHQRHPGLARPTHYGVPYSLTEEFVAVYRMHPLIPDDWSFRAARRRRARSPT